VPLIRIDAIEGRSREWVRGVLAAAHRAMLAAFKVPQRDRYRISPYPGYRPAGGALGEYNGKFISSTVLC
jgi:hypothetical protein